jgi:DNA-binding beta-propeller fold protein YncE
MNRRKWLALTGGAAFSACSRTKGTGFYGYALVANAGDSSLAAVDLTTFRLTGTVGLSAPPSQIVSGPGGRAYTLTPSNGTVHMVADDSRLMISRSRRLADQLHHLSVSRDGQSLLTLAPHGNELIQLDLSTLEPLVRHRFSVPADRIDFSSNGYAAAASSSGDLELLHLTSGRRTQVKVPPLGQIRFRSDGKVLLTANLQNRSLLALDVPTLKTVVELPLAMQPDELCFNADQGQLFVSGQGMDGIAVVFPFDTLYVDQTLLAGRDPGTMACSALPAYLFVASRTGSDLCILNIDTRKVVGFVETGGRPSFITVTPDSQYALVLDQMSGDMGVVRVPRNLTGTERRLKTGGSQRGQQACAGGGDSANGVDSLGRAVAQYQISCLVSRFAGL